MFHRRACLVFRIFSLWLGSSAYRSPQAAFAPKYASSVVLKWAFLLCLVLRRIASGQDTLEGACLFCCFNISFTRGSFVYSRILQAANTETNRKYSTHWAQEGSFLGNTWPERDIIQYSRVPHTRTRISGRTLSKSVFFFVEPLHLAGVSQSSHAGSVVLSWAHLSCALFLVALFSTNHRKGCI